MGAREEQKAKGDLGSEAGRGLPGRVRAWGRNRAGQVVLEGRGAVVCGDALGGRGERVVVASEMRFAALRNQGVDSVEAGMGVAGGVGNGQFHPLPSQKTNVVVHYSYVKLPGQSAPCETTAARGSTGGGRGDSC